MRLWNRLKNDRLSLFCLFLLTMVVLLGIFAPIVAPHDPLAVNITIKFAKPSLDYPFGTDQLGRCMLSRLLFGIRTTLFYSVLTMGLTVSIGTIIGILSGFFRGKLDRIVMQTCDVMLSFPSEIMILAIVGALGPSLVNVVVASIISKWAWYTRMIRTMVLQDTDKNFVRFAKVSGCSTWHILRNHVLRGATNEIIALATLDTGFVILSISSLSFLGLGVQAPVPEWGMMLNEAKQVMITHPQQMLAPGLAILLVVASFNYLGDGLRDALDPRYTYKRKEARP